VTARLSIASLPDPILVIGAYGYRNMGDEAILAGLLRELGPEQRVTVVSKSPAETEAMHRIPAVGLAAAVGALRTHRSVLIGGGGLFGSDLGRLGRLIAPFGLLAALAGKRVAIVGVGVDPNQPGMTLAALRALAPHLAAFTVRDEASAQVLAEAGFSARVTGDLSIGLEPATRKEARALLRSAGLDPARPTIGLALTELGNIPAAEVTAAVAGLVDSFPEIQFCVVPMSRHPFVARHNDLLLARRLQAAAPRLAVLEGLHHPGAILALFELFSGAVCMRFHSLLFAERAGTPVIAIPYAAKCRSWLDDHGIEPTPMTAEHLTAALTDVLAERLAWPA